MKRKLPPLNWLRTFESSARNLSFKLAANELNLTSAAVSKQIKNLEYNLGVTLFDRLANGLELTDQGAAYLPSVREAIDKLGNATHELFGRKAESVLNIKVSLVFFIYWLAPRIHRFYTQYPDIDLRVNSNVWVNDGPIETGSDLEIRYGKGRWEGLLSDRLTWDELMPVCSPELIEQGGLTSPSDLEKHTLLSVIGYEEGWGQWLSSVGLSDLKPKKERRFDTLLSTFALAERGLGIALARSSLIAEHLSSGSLVMPFPQAVKTDEAFYLVRRGSAIDNAETPEFDGIGGKPNAASVFRAWLLSEIKH